MTDDPKPMSSFSDLFAAEQEEICGTGETQFTIQSELASEEPWVTKTSRDQVGLALSGGGIRSATFNLGILQGLHEANLLRHVDYLSTVSGGGYIGSFWTRWRNSGKAESFPTSEPTGQPSGPDGIQAIRHLREFSRFLIPRLDLLATELWLVLSKVFGGMLFSMLFGLTVIVTIVASWALLAQWFVYPVEAPLGSWRQWSMGVLAVTTAATFILAEWTTITRDKLERRSGLEQLDYAARAVVIWLLLLLGWFWITRNLEGAAAVPFFRPISPYALAARNFLPSLCSGGVFLLVAAWRLFPFRSESLSVAAAYDRIQARVLAIALVWAALAGLWEVSTWFRAWGAARDHQMVSNSSAWFGGTAAAFSALFAAMRKWIVGRQDDRLKGGTAGKLKDFVPQVIATAAVILIVITVTMLLGDVATKLRWHAVTPDLLIIPFLVWLLLLLWVNPTSLSLHEFYRARLARCYLGAANPRASTAAQNRYTFERAGDDMFLRDDRAPGPVHLICCAANTLGDDRLSTLYRGARSAVLSRDRVGIGSAVGKSHDLLLSAALTASAAAFNSNMGRNSIVFGRASCFLMTMLNLRLGLWIKHPQDRSTGRRWFDLSLLRELFGWTECQIRSPEKPWKHSPPRVHLSDGGHFENLGIYELVRRHCRYIIVADCAADPTSSFGDLANAVRRIREDFGVEIEIDTTPLRTGAEGFAEQHAVVGTIHYDGLSGIDKGVILFFKPVITGDEPTDVLEYRRSNPDFPQQSTGDQFYSESQWESYRRLGQHSIHSHLRNLELENLHQPQSFFRAARLSTEKVPWEEDEVYAAVSDRCNDLEDFFRQNAPDALKRELLPEVNVPPAEPEGQALCNAELSSEVFFVLLRILQTLEEIAAACNLYSFWSHPFATAWMNYVRRWTNLPTLRHHWPLLKPMFASDFGQFLERKCGMPDVKSLAPSLSLILYSDANDRKLRSGLAGQQFFAEPHPDAPNTIFLALQLQLFGCPEPVQIGIARLCIDRQPNRTMARWDWDDFYIANSLRGGGFTSWFLDRILEHLATGQNGIPRCDQAQVNFLMADLKTSQTEKAGDRAWREAGKRRQIVELVDFYRSRKFRWESDTTMVRDLTATPKANPGPSVFNAQR